MKTFKTIVELKAWLPLPCVVVFGSYRPQEGSPEYAEAEELGRRLAEHGFTVCSGGYAGVMEAALKGAVSNGGKGVAVLTKYFDFLTLQPNKWVQACVIKEGLADRMEGLYHVGDAFVACPGSTGTLAEVAVTLELINKSQGRPKPFICLRKFWEPVIQLIGQEARPFHPGQRVETLVAFADTVKEVIAILDRKLGSMTEPV